MIAAAQQQLADLGLTDRIDTVLADGGYWNHAQISALDRQGLTTIVSPQASYRTTPRRRARKQGTQADRIAAILATEDGQQLYRRRQQIVEPVFAHFKYLRGIDRLARRGLNACRAEWRLITATHNLLKLYRAPATA